MGTNRRNHLVGALGAVAAAFAAAGCEDPPPPTPAAAFELNLRDTGVDCPLVSHTAAMGVIGTADELELVSNGSAGASVECSVEGDSSFTISAELDDAADLRINITGFSADSTVDNPATGTLSY